MSDMIYWRQIKERKSVFHIQSDIRMVHIEMGNYKSEGGEEIGTKRHSNKGLCETEYDFC